MRPHEVIVGLTIILSQKYQGELNLNPFDKCTTSRYFSLTCCLDGASAAQNVALFRGTFPEGGGGGGSMDVTWTSAQAKG